jgi:hypothetical protein
MPDLPRRMFLFSAAATLLGAQVSLANTDAPPRRQTHCVERL